MHSSVRRRRRETAALFALALPAFVACEDPATFTEPEEVSFTAVAIDKATVRPREGERLTAGPTEYTLELDVHWQGMPSGSELGVWLETYDSVNGQTFRWEGDLLEGSETLPRATGSTSFETTFTLPEVSPFCGSYDYARILAVVFPGGDPPPNEAYRDEVFYEVSGSDWTGPCIGDLFAVLPGTTYRIGEPILVYGRSLPDALDVSLPGAQQSDNVFPEFIRLPETESLYPVPNDGYMIAFVPVGATSGRLRGYAGGTEVRYSEDGTVFLNVDPSADDALEPNNDPAAAASGIYFDVWDPWGVWGAYGFNPSLTMAGADLNPDALAPSYGEGDWFYVVGIGDATTEIDVCINVASHRPAEDDIDLIVYDSLGVIAAEGSTATGTEAVRIENVSGDDLYWAWVAPYLAGYSSTVGGYRYEVGRCDDATGTEIARPQGPVGFFGGAAPRIQTTNMPQWGGER